MKKYVSIASLILAFFLLQGCGGSDSVGEKLNGKWTCDIAQTVKTQAGGVEINDAMIEQMGASLKEMTLAIDTAKKEITVNMFGTKQVSTYTVESETADSITVKADNGQVTFSFEKNDKGEELLVFAAPSAGVAKVYFKKAK